MIAAADYSQRRNLLFEALRDKSASVLIYGRQALKRIPSVQYSFNQFSDLVYLTGYTRPSGALTIHQHEGKTLSTLYLPPRIPHEELWEGFRTDYGDAQKLSGVDRVVPMAELEDWVSRYAQNPHKIYSSSPPQQRIHNNFGQFNSISVFLDHIRIIKSPKEIALIQKACDISKIAHKKSLSCVKPGMYERQIASRFLMECYEHGATGLAYPTVAASGKNALSLHYLENNKIMNEGEVLMMDAGCEYHNYASDFTNTVPIGKISRAHSDLLEMVDDVKKGLVQKVKNGKIYSLGHLHKTSEEMLLKGLKTLGMSIDAHRLRNYYPHGVSHWIGVDVHDYDSVRYDFTIRKGCVFSVEPGIYLPKGAKDVPKELQGLGCRFEDTVIVE